MKREKNPQMVFLLVSMELHFLIFLSYEEYKVEMLESSGLEGQHDVRKFILGRKPFI
jgi:hypothetical protein